MKFKKTLFLLASVLSGVSAQAQLSTNPDKFLGNITTSYNVDYGSEKYYTLWNQITCENESKWASIEGTNNSFNWGGSDNAYNYAKNHNFPFKFHALVWGSQYPSWLEKQTPEQRYKEIVQWMDQVKKHYPNLQLIDVVNEAITGHQAGTPYFIEALGGTGVTGYDWLIKAFELAYERWPNAILIYNDFNTFQWNTDQYIDLVKTLRDAGAPIDAYGCQSHDLTDCSFANFKNSMQKIQNALRMPMYSTEYDIGTSDDALQLQRYKEQIPYMWEADYVAGVTLWGYIYGRTWTTDGNSGIIKNGADRPAMTWLREYMKSDAAKNAKSPFPGMVKEASVYVKPASLNVEKGTETSVTVRAKMRTKTIEKVDFYVKGQLVQTMTEAPYVAKFTPAVTGSHELKAVVTCTDGTQFTRYSEVTSSAPRAPYKNVATSLPGTIQAENFDTGADGIAFHDNNKNKEGDAASYRSDVTGIDVVKGGTGYAVGYGEVGEWMEYTVDVKEAGTYMYTLSYSAPENGASFSLSLSTPEGQTLLTDEKEPLPSTGDWSTYKSYQKRTLIPLEAGKQVIRLSITGGTGTYVTNIDKITFAHVNLNENIKIQLATGSKEVAVGDETAITAKVASDVAIKNVRFYVNGIFVKAVTTAPYVFSMTPEAKGDVIVTAFAIDADNNQSDLAICNLVVAPKRTPYKTVTLPGIVEAEDFDKGEEGFTFHDSDATDDGKAGYRTDNEGVDIKKLSIGGYGLGWTNVNEWYEYTVDVTQTGLYSCEAICSSGTTGGSFAVAIADNGMVIRKWTISVSQTANNSWDTYKTFKAARTYELTEGKHIIRIIITGANCDIDKLEFKCVSPTGVEDVTSDEPATNRVVYSVSGMPVSSSYKGFVIKNGKKFIRR